MNRRIRFDAWCSTEGFASGSHDGSTVADDRLRLATPVAVRSYDDPHGERGPVGYETATWTSPDLTPGFDASELVPSWNAETPAGTWIEVSLSCTTVTGERTGWYVLGRWAAQDTDILPTSVPGQDDDHAKVEVDRLCVLTPLVSYRLRVTLLRAVGSSESPSVSLLGVLASLVPQDAPAQVSRFGLGDAALVDVPAYSQILHRGEYPQWDAGGESWCSPTSTTMLLAHWGRGPVRAEYAWVEEGYADRFIDFAARHTFDHSYKGAGNWPFNTAYAARYGVRAYVTRLADLTEAERFIAAGVPLVASVAFEGGDLDGAGYDTQGHLLTIVGFDERGNVVSNDPASHGIASNDEVRTTYDRAQFERAWLGSAGGLVYVIHPLDVPLPDPDPAEPHWLPSR